MDMVMRLASKRALVIFSTSSCCICHTVKTLFFDLGVYPDVHELDEEPMGREMEKALIKITGRKPTVPAVFIGGKFIGGTENVMSLHLGGKLVPLLKDAGALWL
ncbi:putative glutaredoxin-C14 [Asparagus officinalis]|uniref:putative glutaredoxin-C14 n=1 Tax=Asparagus officinalis TaxID=4686 RepID=UPI00098E2EAE|nr:putative glutaredoxin-C14 [Asparagus officinalis]